MDLAHGIAAVCEANEDVVVTLPKPSHILNFGLMIELDLIRFIFHVHLFWCVPSETLFVVAAVFVTLLIKFH